MDILFYISLMLCSLALLIFNKALISGIGINYKTVPFLLFSAIFFVVVPFVNVFFDVYVQKSLLSNSPEWDMAILNFVNAFGLIIGLFAIKCAKPSKVKNRSIISLNRANNFINICVMLLPLCILYGVYSNYLSRDVSSSINEQNKTIIEYIFIETVPLFFCWMVATYYHVKNKTPNSYIGILIISLHLMLVVLLNSSRGSRVAMLLQLIIAHQIFMNTVFKYKPIHYIIGILVLYITMPIYAYYKYGGVEDLTNYWKYGNQSEIVNHYNDPLKFIVGDLGRADIQAPILRGVLEDKIEPRYWPETYTAALLQILPATIRPSFASPKTVVGAEAQIKLDASSPLYQNSKGETISTRIYSLIGEGLLNFGIISIPFLFFVFGFISRKALYRTNYNSWPTNLTNPFFSLFPIYMLFYDFDNIIFQSIVVWGLPLFILKYFSKISFKSKL